MNHHQVDDQLRETMFEAYELSIELRGLLDTADPHDASVRVDRDDLDRLTVILPLIAGFSLASVPITRTIHRAEATSRADPESCAAALAKLLDQIDYTHGGCSIDAAIGQLVQPEALIDARSALNRSRQAT